MLFQEHKPLKDFTTFRIGGSARYFVQVNTSKEMQEAFFFAKSHFCPFFILGKGSNVLFPDNGYEGLIIYNAMESFQITGNTVTVNSGFSLPKLLKILIKEKISGLEFAAGIPGTIGGAVYMNAGAHGKEISHVLENVTFMFSDGSVEQFEKKNLSFAYRLSPFQKMQGAILSASFSLVQDPSGGEIFHENLRRRKNSQPLMFPNAGCIFRNPEGTTAGKLIDECGLKGKKIGGAVVSDLHANFILNEKNASCQDVVELMALICSEVEKKTGIILKSEICIP